jgi:hypothetical protein
MEKGLAGMIRQATKLLLLFVIYFIWLEMVTPQLIPGVKIYFTLLCITLAFSVFTFLLDRNQKKLLIPAPLNRGVLVLLSAYFCIDLLGIMYSEVPAAAVENYKSHAVMAVISILIIILFKSKRDIYRIFIAIGFASVTISAWSIYTYLNSGSLIYSNRVSMFNDYNVFGTQIIIGTGILLLILIRSSLNRLISIPLAVLVAVTDITVILLTGSRRSILLMIAVAFIISLYFVTGLIKTKRLIPVIIGLIVFSACGFYVLNTAMDEFMKFDSRNGLTLTERYSTLYNADGYDSRLTRWNIALEEFGTYDLPEVLFGKGTGYDKYLYSRLYSTESDYPHNTFLSDMLNGGLLKLGIMTSMCWLIFKQVVVVGRKDRKTAAILIVAWLTIFSNNLITGSGIVFYMPFWIFLFLNYIAVQEEVYGQ